jgi:peptidoglycan/LPS O-acetylase OafA/YrhL
MRSDPGQDAVQVPPPGEPDDGVRRESMTAPQPPRRPPEQALPDAATAPAARVAHYRDSADPADRGGSTESTGTTGATGTAGSAGTVGPTGPGSIGTVLSTAAPERAGSSDRARSHAYPHLDGLRAIAALSVVCTHVGFQTGRSLDDGPFAPFLARMDFGVTIFFLLSGFLLYRPFVLAALADRPRPGLRRFWLRRALRILPAYWLALAATLLAVAVTPMAVGDLVAYGTLTHPYTSTPADPATTHLWTLTVELAFYAALPALAALSLPRGGDPRSLLRRQAVLFAGMAAVAVGWALTLKASRPGHERALLWLPAYLDWFALGMAAAVVSAVLALGGGGRLRTLERIADDSGTCWLIGGLLFWIATLPLAGPRTLSSLQPWEWLNKHVLYGAAAAFLLLPAVLGDRERGGVRRMLASRPLRFLGEVSYGVYLWHLAVLTALFRVLHVPLFQGRFLPMLGLTAAVAVLLATASYRLVERPLLELVPSSRRRGRSRQAASSGGVSTPASATAQSS